MKDKKAVRIRVISYPLDDWGETYIPNTWLEVFTSVDCYKDLKKILIEHFKSFNEKGRRKMEIEVKLLGDEQ